MKTKGLRLGGQGGSASRQLTLSKNKKAAGFEGGGLGHRCVQFYFRAVGTRVNENRDWERVFGMIEFPKWEAST